MLEILVHGLSGASIGTACRSESVEIAFVFPTKVEGEMELYDLHTTSFFPVNKLLETG